MKAQRGREWRRLSLVSRQDLIPFCIRSATASQRSDAAAARGRSCAAVGRRALSRRSRIDLRHMVAGRLAEEAHAADHRAAFFVGRAEIEPADAGERNRRRAHRAGLERHVEIGAGEPLGDRPPRRRRGSPASRHARSGRCSRVRLPACATTVPSRDDDRADRHLAARRRGFGLGKCDRHEIGPAGPSRQFPSSARASAAILLSSAARNGNRPHGRRS